MISKTQKIYKRRAKNHAGRQTIEERTWFGGSHTEVIARNTWWLLWVIPLYVRETIVGHDLTL